MKRLFLLGVIINLISINLANAGDCYFSVQADVIGAFIDLDISKNSQIVDINSPEECARISRKVAPQELDRYGRENNIIIIREKIEHLEIDWRYLEDGYRVDEGEEKYYF